MFSEVLAISRKEHREIGLSGQAPGDSSEFGQFLVEQGIDDIALNPDTVFTTTLAALETERKPTKK